MSAAIVAGFVVLIAAAAVIADLVLDYLHDLDRRRTDAERHGALIREIRRHPEGPT